MVLITNNKVSKSEVVVLRRILTIWDFEVFAKNKFEDFEVLICLMQKHKIKDTESKGRLVGV